MSTLSLLATAVLVSLALAATALVEQAKHPARLDEKRMAATVKALYDLGPAAQGTPGKDAVRAEIVRRLKEVAPRVLELPFQGAYVHGQPVGMVNVLGSFRPEATKRVLLMAHWDTRLWAEKDPDPARQKTPIPGADDGFSGVAVLLEVAGALKAHPPPDDLGVDLAFLDGEEGPEGHIDMYFQGARRLADTWFDTGLHLPQAGVLVDMVGHKGLRIAREANSNEKAKGVLDEIFAVAAAQKSKVFADQPGVNILDDHIPFLSRDLPVVDLIDFDYPYWHTTQDTLDKLDPAGMVEVGQVILGWIDHRAR